MKRKYIITGLLLFSSYMSFSQDNNSEKLDSDIANGWYVELGAGTHCFFGRDASSLKFTERFTPSLSLTAGKWITSALGVRLQISGWSLNGFNNGKGYYMSDDINSSYVYGTENPVCNEVVVRPDGSYRYYLRFMDVHADFQLSMFNLFASYPNKCKWDIIPAVGIGYTHTFAYKGVPSAASLSTHFSLMGKYRINSNFDVNVETFTSILPDRFDGRITDAAYEPVWGVRAGLTYNFGCRPKTKVGKKEKVDTDALLENIRNIVKQEVENNAGGYYRTDTVYELKEVEVLIPDTTPKIPVRIASFRYGAGQITPLDGQEIQFENIVEYIRLRPSASLIVEGYADDKTGSKEYNRKIADQRVDNICDLLVEEYNIPNEQIKKKSFGSEVQIYENNSWNRVVIIKVLE